MQTLFATAIQCPISSATGDTATPNYGQGAQPVETQSPFRRLLGPDANCLAPALQEQYLLAPGAPHFIVMTGIARHVWHRPKWLGYMLRLLCSAGMLFAETGHAVPAILRIDVGRDPDGTVRHTWQRTFCFRPPRTFDAELRYDPALNRIIERLGLGGLLEAVWRIQATPPSVIAIDTEGMALRLGTKRLWLPRLLLLSVRAVERADVTRHDTVHLDLRMRHPLLGPVFGYDGTFRLARVTYGNHEASSPVGEAHVNENSGRRSETG
jgi:hypothetical protein